MVVPFREIKGPVIAGFPDGYPRYFHHKWSAPYATEKRTKPVGAEAILGHPTPWIREYTTLEKTPVVTDSGLAPPQSGLGFLTVNGVLPYTEQMSMLERSRNRILNKIKGEKWNANVFLAELAKTRSYLATALLSVTRSLLDLLKYRNPKQLRKLARKGKEYLKRRGFSGAFNDATSGLSKKWMEWRYAVSPLVYDVQDMVNYLIKESVKPDIRRCASGAGKNAISSVITEDYSTYKITTAVSGEAQMRLVAFFRVNKGAEAFKQLGLINLAAVLWEVTPLSFVADWFLPIGEKIGHIDALLGVDVLSCTKSLSVKATAVRSSYTVTWTDYDKVVRSSTTGPQKATLESYNRSLMSLPKPSYLNSSVPKGKQLIDTVALCKLLIFNRR